MAKPIKVTAGGVKVFAEASDPASGVRYRVSFEPDTGEYIVEVLTPGTWALQDAFYGLTPAIERMHELFNRDVNNSKL